MFFANKGQDIQHLKPHKDVLKHQQGMTLLGG